MTYDLRFQLAILPNTSWDEFLRRFQAAEELGFDLAGTADHYTDWSNPASSWFEMWTALAGVATRTSRIRIGPTVAQIPLRNPAMFARQALTLDHISNGRLELGMGIGLTIDPSYEIMGIPNWSNKERVQRFAEYMEIVDQLLSNETTDYQGNFYQVNNAIMSPRPVQNPRPPITIAAMGKIMLKRAVQYADTWNSLSFELDFEKQLEQTRDRISIINEHCSNLGRDPESLRRCYWMLDMNARPSGGNINYWESEEIFAKMVREIMSLGMSDISVYYPLLEEQIPVFESVAKNVMPELKAEYKALHS
jgi:alkanesulfonate monooxygenase SsuD/methylene tetrahydromethanopterin reductase-like flavin-dependent oxidoreductase (luciferase family)